MTSSRRTSACAIGTPAASVTAPSSAPTHGRSASSTPSTCAVGSRRSTCAMAAIRSGAAAATVTTPAVCGGNAKLPSAAVRVTTGAPSPARVSSVASCTSSAPTGAPASVTRPATRRAGAPSCANQPGGASVISALSAALSAAISAVAAVAAAGSSASRGRSARSTDGRADSRAGLVMRWIITSAQIAAIAASSIHATSEAAPATGAGVPRAASGPSASNHGLRWPPCRSSSRARSRCNPSFTRDRTVPAGTPSFTAIAAGSRPSANRSNTAVRYGSASSPTSRASSCCSSCRARSSSLAGAASSASAAIVCSRAARFVSVRHRNRAALRSTCRSHGRTGRSARGGDLQAASQVSCATSSATLVSPTRRYASRRSQVACARSSAGSRSVIDPYMQRSRLRSAYSISPPLRPWRFKSSRRW